MKKTNIFGLVLILSTLLIGCAQPNMCADISEVYTITCGTNVTANKTQAMAGEMITVTASRDGYRTTEIKVDGERVSETSSATFTMPTKNVNVDATFIQLYTISSTVTGGTITIPTSAAAGDTITITNITADNSGWYNSNCTISVSDFNGNTIDVSNNSFTMPKGNVTVTVAFDEKDFTNRSDITVKFYLKDNSTDNPTQISITIDGDDRNTCTCMDLMALLVEVNYTNIMSLKIHKDLDNEIYIIDNTNFTHEVDSVTLSGDILSIIVKPASSI